MNVQEIRIWLLPLTRRSLNYAAAQKFSRTRTDGVLVMTDEKPEIPGAKEIRERGALTRPEQEWVCFGLAEVMYPRGKRDRMEAFWNFLERLEKALEEIEKGGDGVGENTGE